MTQRSRLATLGLLLLAVAGLAVWLSRSAPGGGEAQDVEAAPPRGAGHASEGPGLEGLRVPGEVEPVAPGGTATTSAGVPPGIRRPEGLDLSDPAQRRAYLRELLAKKPIPWQEVADVVRVFEEPLDPDVRATLLTALRIGDRNGVLLALFVLRDPTFVPELLAVLDDPLAAEGARRAALLALAQMPGAERVELVKQLESRLTGSSTHDGGLLDAIARRGGPEAARAVTEYVARSPEAALLGQSLVGRLDLAGDAEAAAVFGAALARVTSPDALATLVRVAGYSGAAALAGPLVALDRDDTPEALRLQVLEALSQIGSAESLGHLLEVGRQPGQYGERALLALAQVRGATPEAAELLTAELERSGLNPHPEIARSALLEAVGAARATAALPQVVAFLRDADDRVKNSAIRSLGRMGPLARAHVADISRLFAGGGEATRISVASSLASIGGPEAAAALETLLLAADLGPSLKRTLQYALRQARGEPLEEGSR